MPGPIGDDQLFGGVPSAGPGVGWSGNGFSIDPGDGSFARGGVRLACSDVTDSGDACSICAERGGGVSLDFEHAAATKMDDTVTAIRTVFMRSLLSGHTLSSTGVCITRASSPV
jgi:hypothetical protein